MTEATVVTAPATDLRSAGEIACEKAAVPGANVATLLKAVWSTRGFLRVNYGPSEAFGGLGIVKADLVGILKALPPADAAPYLLVPVPGGAELRLVA